MNVRELIVSLLDFDMEAEVSIQDSNDTETVEITAISAIEENEEEAAVTIFCN